MATAATTPVSSGASMIQASSGGTPMAGKPMDPRRDDMKGNLYIGVVAAAGGAVLVASVGNDLVLWVPSREPAWVGNPVLTVLVRRGSGKLAPAQCPCSFSGRLILPLVNVFSG